MWFADMCRCLRMCEYITSSHEGIVTPCQKKHFFQETDVPILQEFEDPFKPWPSFELEVQYVTDDDEENEEDEEEEDGEEEHDDEEETMIIKSKK